MEFNIIFKLALFFILLLIYCLFIYFETQDIDYFLINKPLILKFFVSFLCGVIQLYFNYYLMAAYFFVGSILLLIGPSTLKYTREDLRIETNKIDQEILPKVFELKFFHIFFIFLSLSVAFLFQFFLGPIYFMFIIVGVIGGIFKFNIYKLLPNKIYLYTKSLKKDFCTINYHWGSHFLFFKIFTRLTLFSLPLGSGLLLLALPYHVDGDPILFLNIYQIILVFCLGYFGSFLIDMYIIFFGNSSVLNKFTVFCYKCGAFTVTTLVLGNVAEHQLLYNSLDKLNICWQPTIFTNGMQRVINGPIYLDYDQFHHCKIIQKYLVKIDSNEYLITDTTRYYRGKVVDSVRTTQIIVENWETISQHATQQEIGRIRLGEGWLKGGKIVRK